MNLPQPDSGPDSNINSPYCEYHYRSLEYKSKSQVAAAQLLEGRIFGQITQNSKNIPWPGKLSGRKMADFVQKEAEKIYSQIIREIPFIMQFFQCFLISEASK
jgi:hypothetical protein